MTTIEEIEEEAQRVNDEIKKEILSGHSLVQKFYDNAVVFVTGGSGFVGKHMIEKILRSSNIKKIYILLRVKKGRSVQDRLKIVLDDSVFEELLKEQPNFAEKLQVIEGDCCEDNLGIDEKNWAKLSDEVNVIIHSAATTNFRENMKSATFINIKGTRDILRLAQACKHLKSIVHVSTAYSYATRSRIKGDVREDFYKSPIPPETMIELANNLDEEKLNAMMKPFLHEWPNSYTFTKAIGEELVRVMGEDLPICIVRPAIVISAYREPMLGWLDDKNVYGASGMILGLSLGVMRTIIADNNIKIDFVPVDIVSNVIITAAAETQDRHIRGERETIIYTVSGIRNPMTWKEIGDVLQIKTRTIISSKTLWYCNAVVTPNKFFYFILTVLFHYIPAIIIDGCCMLVGKKARFLTLYRSVHKLSSMFSYFTNNEWKFEDANTLRLHNGLSKTDKIIYNCDMYSVDMIEAGFIWSYGVIKYLIKDDGKNREYALKKQKIMKILHYIILPLYLYALYKLTSGVILYIYFAISMICKYLYVYF
ncbi:fatty acyl-CoA reductase wat-like [Vanessa atalanta]|uniref:fatty acyl-CoA reductase wat-like n=1 Tax=Vanessa atalanta TaxID=42275 RepID=UPI001FCD740E|nr:fatty acyl-CoA reductase wat-like [Vanessa atalanta]